MSGEEDDDVLALGERVLFHQIREGKNRFDELDFESQANDVVIGTPSASWVHWYRR